MPKCGHEAAAGDVFCSRCGIKLDVGARHAVPVQGEAVPKLEDMPSAESHAEQAVSIVDEMSRPGCMARLYSAYLLLAKIEEATDWPTDF